jgi:hypothetical protein
MINMDCRVFYEYYNAIDMLMAREKFEKLEVSNYSMAKKNDRTKLWKDTRNRAFPLEKRISSEAEIQAFLNKAQGR